jgi:hypothetical protein
MCALSSWEVSHAFDTNRRYIHCCNRLIQRRKVVVRTLHYLAAERKIVANQHWKNPLAQQNRRRLLEEIHGWYDIELKKIDIVLDRLNYPTSSFALRT